MNDNKQKLSCKKHPKIKDLNCSQCQQDVMYQIWGVMEDGKHS